MNYVISSPELLNFNFASFFEFLNASFLNDIIDLYIKSHNYDCKKKKKKSENHSCFFLEKKKKNIINTNIMKIMVK